MNDSAVVGSDEGWRVPLTAALRQRLLAAPADGSRSGRILVRVRERIQDGDLLLDPPFAAALARAVEADRGGALGVILRDVLAAIDAAPGP